MHKVLGIERFDRRLHAAGGWWMRLPQEDFCQARGLPPTLKYESDGGSGMQSICEILHRLTPLYDVISTWPVIGHGAGKLEWQKARLAMSVRGESRHYRLHEIQRRHFNAMAVRRGLGADADKLIQGLIERTASVIDKVAREPPQGFPDAVTGPILDKLYDAALRLGEMPAK